MQMRKIIVANWKMNKTINEAIFLAKGLKKLLKDERSAEIVICPPFTALQAVSKELKGSKIKLGAQNMHYEKSGAYTGEISAVMLKDIGCSYIILGHSERRDFFGETNLLINKKIVAALDSSLKPILCIGENLEQRKNDETKEVIENQIHECLNSVNKTQINNVVIAYEPIWAISKGDPNRKSATPEEVEEMHTLIRNTIAKIYSKNIADNLMIIYGGSVNPGNANVLLSLADVNGALVGNASLDAKSFAEIIKAV